MCKLAGVVEGAAAGERKVEDESQYEGKGAAGGAGEAAGAAVSSAQTDKGGEGAELKKKERSTFTGTQFPCVTSTKVQILTRLSLLS